MSIAAFLSAVCDCSESEGAEFSLRPSVTIREEYDDNIFLTKDNRVDDYITRVMPSAYMNYKTPLWDWTFDYTLIWWYYSKRGESNTSHNLTLMSKVNVIKNLLYLDISDTYSIVVLNPREPSTESNLVKNRTDSNTFNVSPYIKYQLDTTTALSAGYRYTNVWYKEAMGIDREMHTGYTNIEHIFSPKLNASLWVEYTADRPDTDPELDSGNNDQKALYFKASYNIGPRTKFDGNAGYRWIDFSQGRDEDRTFYDAGLTYRLREAGQAEIRFSSTYITSPLYGVLESRTEQLAVRYGEALSVNGSIYHRKDRYLEKERKDDAVGGAVGLEYKPDPRLTFSVSGRHEKDKFLPEGEKRKIYGASGAIAYQLTKKATFSMTYNHTKEDGRIDIYDYTNNVVAAQIRIAL